MANVILAFMKGSVSFFKWCVILLFIVTSCHLPIKSGTRQQYHSSFVSATDDNPDISFDMLYTRGIDSYLENDWASCISYFELSLNDWHWWNMNIARCRGTCYKEANSSLLIFPSSKQYEMDRMFEKTVLNTLCLVKCKKKVFGSRMDKRPSANVIADFEKKKPYDYLQLCYFKQGSLEKAAAAAVTIIATQPDHETMLANFKYYVKEGGLDLETIVSMEMEEYVKDFLEGDRLYIEENYVETIVHLERSLESFWKSLQECRLGCDNPFDMGWFPDFVSSIANHYTFTLRCKVMCSLKLSASHMEEGSDYVATVFNYLQYSYYKVGDLPKACEAVTTILLLTPADGDQLKNKEFFMQQKEVSEGFFTPRETVVDYEERRDLEAKLLSFIDTTFTVIAEEAKHEFEKGVDQSSRISQALIPSISRTLLEMADMLGGNHQGSMKDREEL